MVGGNGDDTYVMDRATDVVVEAAGGGVDTVRSTTNITLAANVENLIATGTSSQTLTGNASANTLTGNAAANVLDGLGGADTMVGGAGNDTYVVDSLGDVIVELTNQGVDTVRTTLGAYTLGANLENLTQLGSTPFTGTGNNMGNSLVGGGAADILDGRGGADSLKGGGGADRFILRVGEANNDVVQDFTGAGAAAGDSLSFQGFGQGTISKVAGQTDLYRVTAEVGGASEVFRLLGVTDLDTHAGAGHNDVFFV
jgi:Ca2+-binding RTX toxin-like protein